MDLALLETKKETEGEQSQDPQVEAEAILKRRVVALIESVTYVLFSYVAQVHSILIVFQYLYQKLFQITMLNHVHDIIICACEA